MWIVHIVNTLVWLIRLHVLDFFSIFLTRENFRSLLLIYIF